MVVPLQYIGYRVDYPGALHKSDSSDECCKDLASPFHQSAILDSVATLVILKLARFRFTHHRQVCVPQPPSWNQ